MAKDNDKGLYLPLRVDFDAWEQSLASLDEPLQKKMRELRKTAADIKLKYQVEISGAKAAGDQLKVMELETKKLNELMKLQTATVNGLTEAYKKQVEQEGANSKGAQALAREIQRQTIELNKMKEQYNNLGAGLGTKIADSLSAVSPAFATFRNSLNAVTSQFKSLQETAGGVGIAIGSIGVAITAAAASYKALGALTNYVDNVAEAGRNASDKIYQLRETMESSNEEAEKLWAVTAIDGSSADSLNNALIKLNRTLKKDADGTSLAAQTLKRYGAEIRDAQGNLKSHLEILQEISKARNLAASRGELGDFKAGLGGAFATTEFDHLLAGLNNYIALAESAKIETKYLYDELHSLGDLRNANAEVERQIEAIKGGIFAGAAKKNLEERLDYEVALGNALVKNSDEYGKVAEKLGEITTEFTAFKGAATLAWESIKKDVADNIETIKGYADKLKSVHEWMQKIREITPVGKAMGWIGDKVSTYLGDKYNTARAELDAEKEKAKQRREQKKKEAAEKDAAQKEANKNAKLADITNKKQTKADEAAAQKRADAQKKLAEELRSIQQTEYEREIQRIADKRDAFIAAGASEVDASKLYALEKEAIDKKYYDKQRSENAKMVKQAQDAYKQMADAQKRQREANISEAEKNLQNNLKIIRKLKKEEAMGGDYIGRTKEYADKLYKKKLGVKDSDIAALAKYGNALISDIANARDRVLGIFGGEQAPQPQQNVNNQNTVNVTFDNTVIDNEAGLVNLANKVAQLIIPSIEKAIGGDATSNNYAKASV